MPVSDSGWVSKTVPATIGDFNRSGLVQITDTRWDGNGTLFVTVREMIGGFSQWRGGKPQALAAMRNLARRTISHPELTHSARTVRTFYAEGQHHATFAVSRIEVS